MKSLLFAYFFLPLHCVLKSTNYYIHYTMIKRDYREPQMEILYIEVEAGFTASGEDYSGLPGEDPEFNDFGEF